MKLFEFNWKQFRAKLMLKNLTITQWCRYNEMDHHRYTNIQQGKVQPTEKEIALFNKVVEG